MGGEQKRSTITVHKMLLVKKKKNQAPELNLFIFVISFFLLTKNINRVKVNKCE